MIVFSTYHIASLTVTQSLVVSDGQIRVPQFRLIWSRGFAHPVHCMWYGDLTHDGLRELIVVSTGGVHVLQVWWYMLNCPSIVDVLISSMILSKLPGCVYKDSKDSLTIHR